ncbi:uncharacterized protein GO595_009366 [Histomonas meleagridis]|uniref:uncharacterized protein n=1 Tax=Histomonas meleagridis TaxID=135588 RepID=UPI003559F314|nr:hypothetical protein GO595_009366 [Histomonas meleagridis]
MIFCSVCHCQFHIECIEDETDNPTWVCPYCLQESSQALLNKGIDLSILSQEIGNNKMTQVIANSYQDSANISELFEKSSAWVSAIISRDDVYFNLEDIVRSSVDEEGGMQLPFRTFRRTKFVERSFQHSSRTF